jgi:ABC-type transporter Mla MlaB component
MLLSMPDMFREEKFGPILLLEVNAPLQFGPSLNLLSRRIKAETTATRIVIDLANCPRIDSAGLGELLLCFGQASRFGRQLVLCEIPEQALRVIQVT